ncbi:NAD(P)-binding protein [Tricholoma matsutake]|nr:NAD(P)-binding protein [Tricholoma matsutake 945]
MSSEQTYTRVALVTGAAQGIGRAIALRLAADGLDVAVDDIPSESQRLEEVVDEIKKMGRKSIALTCDISKEDEVKSMVNQTVSELGRLDAMIANAGIGHPGSGMTIDANVQACEVIFGVNVIGTLLCYKYAAKQMVKQGSGGRIIGASSGTGLRGFAGVGAYGMSKAAIRSLTQTTALELVEHDITVNAYAPGLIETKLIASEYDSHFGGQPGAAAKHGLKVPHAKVGKVDDVSGAVSYLVSPQAHFITGQTLVIDGGIIFN